MFAKSANNKISRNKITNHKISDNGLRACSKQSGAALVELSVSLFIALTLVLGTMHIGAVLREANIAVIAARHGARSAAAASSAVLGGTIPPWVTQVASQNHIFRCDNTANIAGIPAATADGNRIAIQASCAFLIGSGLKADEWNVSSTILAQGSIIEGRLAALFAISVTVSPVGPRGLVTGASLDFKKLLNMRPQATSVFPLEAIL